MPAAPIGIVWGIVALVLFLPACGMALHNSTLDRSVQATNEASLPVLSDAIARYRAHMGTTPETLETLTREVKNGAGTTAGPFLKEHSRSGVCRGTIDPRSGNQTLLGFSYRRWENGRYFLKCPHPWRALPTLLQTGS